MFLTELFVISYVWPTQFQSVRNTFFRFTMVWDDHEDDMLVREILLFEPFKFKQCTKERGNAWKMVADNLNEMDPEKFTVYQRGVRDRFAVPKAHLEAK